MIKTWVNVPDVLFFQEGPGVRNTQYTSDGVKLLNVANLIDGNIDLSKSDRYISEEEAYGKYKHFLCDEGDFIVASSGIKVEYIDKKMGFVENTMLPLCMNTSTIRFKSLDQEKLRIRYFMYYLKSNHFKRQLFKQITGSAQLNYGPSHLKKMMVPLTDIEKQDRIIAELDRTQNIINKYEKELMLLDKLIKARFVEMFGDPVSNSMGWETMTLDGCFEITSSKRLLKSEWKTEGIPFLRVRDMVQLAITGTMDNEFFVSEELYSTLSDDDGVPKAGDILVSATSTLGKCHVVKPGERFYFKDADVLRFRSKNDIDPVFFIEQLKTNYVEKQIFRTLGVTTVPHFTIKAAKTIEIRIPESNLQHQFADFVAQVDKSKVVA